jgi:hypothetical protein
MRTTLGQPSTDVKRGDASGALARDFAPLLWSAMLRRLPPFASFSQLAVPLALALGLATASCSDDSFHVERAPGYPRTNGSAISIFGVYRDGRLAPEAWDPLRSHLAPLFGVSPCEPGYPDILTASGTPALQAVDDYSRANGVTDELLDHLAPMAKTDLILLITMTGRPTKSDSDKDTSGPPPVQTTVPGMRGRGGGTPSSGTQHKPLTYTASFEAVGILFSAKAHRSVAAVRLSYSGTSLDDALQSFMTKLGSEFPQATCGGWKMDGHVDASDIRRLDTE